MATAATLHKSPNLLFVTTNLDILSKHVVGVNIDVCQDPGAGEIEAQLHFIAMKHGLIPSNPA